jgi:hypothetical protein
MILKTSNLARLPWCCYEVEGLIKLPIRSNLVFFKLNSDDAQILRNMLEVGVIFV